MKRWLVLIVLLAACSGGGGSAAPTTTTIDPTVPPQAAIDECQRAVRDELKSPASAQFDAEPPLREAQGPSWHIKGIVDSQNSFGALIRSNYDCVVDPGSLTHDAQEWIPRAYVTDQ